MEVRFDVQMTTSKLYDFNLQHSYKKPVSIIASAVGVSTDKAPVFKAIIVIIIVVVQAPAFKAYMAARKAQRASRAQEAVVKEAA